MPKLSDITGKKFNRLTVVQRAPNRKTDGYAYWDCLCDCGNKTTVSGRNIINGRTKSCGCLQKQIVRKLLTKHGYRASVEYSAWRNMITRCYNKNVKSYKNYGAKGITVCDRWKDSFEAFFEDIGKKPVSEWVLKRKDSIGNYQLDNCYWGPRDEEIKVQKHNDKSSEWVTYFGNINSTLNN